MTNDAPDTTHSQAPSSGRAPDALRDAGMDLCYTRCVGGARTASNPIAGEDSQHMDMHTSSSRAIAVTVLSLLLLTILITSREGGASTTVIGKVKEIKGGALERLDREVWNPLIAKAEVHANDRVRTGPGATAVLVLSDVGLIMVGPNTEYYLGDPSRGFKSLLKHGYLWVSAKLKPGSAMSIATVSAVAGVRGTKFSVIQDSRGMDVCTCKGDVQVALKDGKTVSVTSGMYGSIDPAGKMGAPEKGKPHLEAIWKERPARYAPCLDCHRKGKKTGDLS